jgi:hypothetical protein
VLIQGRLSLENREATMKLLSTTLTLIVLGISASALAEDFETPSDAVNAYITAVSTGSGAHIEEAFGEDARIQYYDGEDAYQSYDRADFAALVDKGDTWDAEIEITNLLRTGKAANATVEFTWGDQSQHGYVDYLNLLYADGSWRITNKVAQYVARD